MVPTFTDPDPYAELDNRADASELSEEFRKPVRVRRIEGCGRHKPISIRHRHR